MAERAVDITMELPELPASLPAGRRWIWRQRHAAWARIYHRDHFTPSPLHRRSFGPLHRFDHHTPPIEAAAVCPEGRTITYVADGLRAAAAEVFGELDPFGVCPRWRLAWLRPTATICVQDLKGPGGMALNVAPWLGSGPVPRHYTQEWARKIYDSSLDLQGIRYTGSHEEGACLALWERAGDLEIVSEEGDRSIVDPLVWSELVTEYAETEHSLVQIEESECELCRDSARAEAGIA